MATVSVGNFSGDPARTVRSGARENHANRQRTSICCQRLQKLIDHGRRTGRRRAGRQTQPPTLDRQQGAGRDDIDVARLDGLPVRGLEDGHSGGASQERRELTRVRGVEVLDNNDGQVGGGWKRGQQPTAGLEAPGGSADPDDRRVPHRPSSQPRFAS